MVGDKRQGYAIARGDGGRLARRRSRQPRRSRLEARRTRARAAAGSPGGPWRARRRASASRRVGAVRGRRPRGTSTGAVNSHARPLHRRSAAASRMLNMMLGEVSPGGVGSGLYGMLVFALLTVFIAGLMVGRTPEYLGKKIERREMKLRRALHPDHAAARARSAPRIAMSWPGDATRRCCNPGAARLHRDALRLHLGRRTTTARRSPASPRTRTLVQHALGARDADRPVLPDRPRRSRSPARWPASSTVPPSAGTLPDRHAAVRRCCSLGVVVIVAGLTFFPALALGPASSSTSRSA